MQTYAYKARKPNGQVIEAKMDAEAQADVIGELTRQGMVIIELHQSRDLKARASKGAVKRRKTGKRLPARELGIFCRQFATLYAAGVPVVPSLVTLRDQAEHLILSDALYSVVNALEAGDSLAVSMKRHPEAFPQLLVNMVAAGELTGRLDTTLVRAGAYFERVHDIETKVRGAMTYPAVVIVVAILVSAFLMVGVLPTFKDIFQSFGMELPIITRMMLGLSDILRAYGWILLLLIVVGLLWFLRWAKTPKGQRKVDEWMLKLPIFGKLTMMNCISRFCRTLAALSRSGVNVVTAMQLVERNVGNLVYSEAVAAAADTVNKGGRISPPLEATGLFPPLVVRMMSVGENTGQLDDMLDQVADFYDRDIEQMTNQMSKLIEPFVIIFLASIVGLIVLSVAIPMFNMMQIVQV